MTSDLKGPPPGWYPDPRDATAARYWTGTSWVAERPVVPPRRWKPWWVLTGAIAAVALTVGVVVALTSGGEGPTPGPGPDPTSALPGPGPVGGRGVIWEDTLGEDFYGGAVSAWTNPCDITDPQSRNLCRPEGWELKLDPGMSVTWVLLYTAEDNGTIAGYDGPLPGGLTWNDGVQDIVAKLGEPASLSGGAGVAMVMAYPDVGGYQVEVVLTALHNRPEEIASAGIKMLYIGRAG